MIRYSLCEMTNIGNSLTKMRELILKCPNAGQLFDPYQEGLSVAQRFPSGAVP